MHIKVQYLLFEKRVGRFTTDITTLRRRERSVAHLELTEFMMDLTRKSKQSNWRMFTELKRFGGAFIAAVLSTMILRLCAVSNTILKFLFNIKLVS